MQSVTEELRSSYHISAFLSNSEFFRKKSDQEIFFTTDLWEAVAAKLVNAIINCTPRHEKDVKKKSLQFEMAKRSIRINDINRHELFASSVTEDGCDPRHNEMTLLL